MAAGTGVREVMPRNRKGLNFPRWYAEAVHEVGQDALATAFVAFLTDKHFKHKQWPVAIFMSDQVWRQRVPPELAGAHREAQIEPAQPPASSPAPVKPEAVAEVLCRWPWQCAVPDCTHPSPGKPQEDT